MYDTRGNPIYFSTVFDASRNSRPIQRSSDVYTNLTLVNGKWKHYATVFKAAGSDYETFVLDGLQSDSSKDVFVANNMIQVFVEDTDGNV